VIDIDFVHWLTEIIVMLDPKKDCVITGYRSDWNGLDKNKSLFFSEDGCGLPIGNLTSQLFSNVYLNILDQWMKRELGCRHYGRYVDDFYVVNCDRDWLLSIIPKTDRLLKERLGLDLHHGKLMVCDARRGVEFLGAYIKPFRTYISNSSLQRIRQNVATTDCHNREKAFRTVNSYLGLMSHYSSYNIRRELFCKDRFYDIGYYDRDMTKITVNHLNLNSEDYEQNVWTKKRFYSRQGGYKPYHRQLWHGASAQHRVCHMA
jgi:hypothetical protein